MEGSTSSETTAAATTSTAAVDHEGAMLPVSILDLRTVEELKNSLAFEEYKIHLYSEDYTLVHKAAQNIRRIASIQSSPPLALIINAGFIPRLVNLLENDEHPEIQFEAAWALSNVVAGTSHDTRVVVDAKACPHLIRLLGSLSENVRDQSAWCIGNIAGDSVFCRDLLLNLGALPALLAILEHKESRISTIRTSTWAIANLFRGKPAPSIEKSQQALPYLAKLILCEDVQTLAEACQILSFISDGTDEKIQMILDQKIIVPKLVKYLNHGNAALQTAALRTIGNIVTGNEKQTQAVIDFGALSTFANLICHEKKNIRKEVCWTISNITAGTADQIQAVLDRGDILPKLIELLVSSDNFEVQKEACWAIANATEGGTVDQILHIIKAGAIVSLCNMLTKHDNKIIDVALTGLDNSLKVVQNQKNSEETNDKQAYFDVLDRIVLDFKFQFDNLGHALSGASSKKSQSTCVRFYDLFSDCVHAQTLLGDADSEFLSQFGSSILESNKAYSVAGLLLSRGASNSEDYDYWPVIMWVIVMQELFIYHLVDCSSMIDLWQYL